MSYIESYEKYSEFYSDEEIELAARTAHSVAQAISEAFNLYKLPAWEQCNTCYQARFTRYVENYIYYGKPCRSAHDLFVKRKIDDGWTLGPYDAENKTRPDLVPFNDLPIEQRVKAKQIRAAVMPFRRHTKADI